MYIMKNGILYCDGKARLGLGVSYFASYHPDKWPVAPDDDRMGQMKLDIEDIAKAGFNNVRNAAFEKLWWEGETVKFDYPFIDSMVGEISRNGMSSVVRLQGYSMNHRQHPENMPLNEKGEKLELHTFVHDCLSNKEVMDDACQTTRVLARHFAQYPDMVGFQIYNEPAYAWGGGYYDYSPRSIQEHRVWLVKNGYKTEAEAREYDPPRQVPEPGADLTDWIRFRLFNTGKMTEMLVMLNAAARQVEPGKESMSNLMSCPFNPKASRMGEDFFPVAKGMDYLGYDAYMPYRGERYYFADSVLSGVESAAAVCRKHAWIIEYCCRTHMTIEDLELETVSALGMGFKGINYYAWRSDAVGPEGGLGGLIRANRTKTPKYDAAVKFIQVMNNLSEKFALSEKLRDGVAILYSNQATIHSDAVDETPQTQVNMTAIYAGLKKLGITADFVTTEDLEKNVLASRLLIVPQISRVSADEAARISKFAQIHPVFQYESSGYKIHPDYFSREINGHPLLQNWCFKPDEEQTWCYRLNEVLDFCGIKPKLHICSKLDSLGFGYLKSNTDEYVLACLTNIHSAGEPVVGGKLYFDEKVIGNISKAIFHDRNMTRELTVQRTAGEAYVDLPAITGGAFVDLQL